MNAKTPGTLLARYVHSIENVVEWYIKDGTLRSMLCEKDWDAFQQEDPETATQVGGHWCHVSTQGNILTVDLLYVPRE